MGLEYIDNYEDWADVPAPRAPRGGAVKVPPPAAQTPPRAHWLAWLLLIPFFMLYFAAGTLGIALLVFILLGAI